MKLLVGAMTAALLASTAAQAAPPPIQGEVDRFLSTYALTATSPAEVGARCDAALVLATRAKTGLEGRKGPASLDQDFSAYDALSDLLDSVGDEMGVISATALDKTVRDSGKACISKISDLSTQVSLSRPIYDRLAAIPSKGLPTKTGYILALALKEYRLAGVDRDAATRAKVQALQTQITDTGLAFDRNIAEVRGEITLKSADDLAGLPQDYIDSHKPKADGLIHITTDYPDEQPLLTFASKPEVRKAMYLAFMNRAWPANEPVLKTLLEKRYQLARLLGYDNFADLVTADKMIGTGAHAAQFLDEVNQAALPAAQRDQAQLVAREKLIDPAATDLHPWDSAYITNLVQKEKYDVDSAVTRQYFTYEKTRAGIFQLVHDLFGVDIRPWTTPVWDKSVTAWELYDHGKLIGRFYLDMFPREGKFTHDETAFLRNGLAGRQIPVAMLICNFPATGPMEHGDVTGFLHEFGHLMHALYADHQQYFQQDQGQVQWDFIEAPSQMLEEWTWDYDTLKRFASNPKGEPIPQALVAKMNAARHFGEAAAWKRQLALSAISLNYHNRPADSFDLTDMYRTQWNKYSLTPYMEGTHLYANFGHLNGYSAIYYTYVWSKAIALDMFSRFKDAGLRDPKTAAAYRAAVLNPGASADANTLITAFLGRPFNLDAFKTELQAQ